MISRLIVSHFKSIETCDVGLGHINVFVGNNGSGKSNVIDAIRFVKDAVQNGLDRAVSDRHGIDSIRQWSPSGRFRPSLCLVVTDDEFFGRYSFSLDSSKGVFRVIKEEAEIAFRERYDYEEDETNRVAIGDKCLFLVRKENMSTSTSWEFGVESEDDDFDATQIIQLAGKTTGDSSQLTTDRPDELIFNTRSMLHWEYGTLRRHLVDFQGYSIYPNTLRTPQEPSNETYLAPEGRNLASILKRMTKNKRGGEALSQITEAMRAIMPNLERISVLSLGGFLVPQFHMIETSGKRHMFNVSQMSDGSLRVLGLLTALYQQPRPSVIALEEPEQTVNPGVLTVLADSIKEVSKRSQILITTHSPHLLDQFDPTDVRTVEYLNGRTRVSGINDVQIGAVRERLFSLGELLVSEGLHP
jgi:predicted ATPase